MPSKVVAINNDDTISRLLFKPKDFLDGLGPLCLRKSLFFQKPDRQESVNCHRLANHYPEDFHQQGRAKALRDSERRKEQNKDPVTYEGFAPIGVETVRSINEDNHSFDVLHSPMNDNAAHCDIELLFPGDKPQKAQRTLAIQKLSEEFSEIIIPD